jgi:hypothetical protein
VKCTTETASLCELYDRTASFCEMYYRIVYSVSHTTETGSFCELYNKISFWAVWQNHRSSSVDFQQALSGLSTADQTNNDQLDIQSTVYIGSSKYICKEIIFC